MFRPLAAGIVLFALHAVFAPVSDADHAPLLYPDGTVVHGDWGLYRPGHMPLRYQYYAASPAYDYFYASPPVVFYGARRYRSSHPVYKDGPDPKGLLPEGEVRRFYPRGDGGFYPTNKEDPGAYTRRENENGPTQPPERYFKQWGANSETCNNCEDGKKTYSDPTIYPQWDMPDNVYVPAPNTDAPAVPVQPPHRPRR